MIALVIIVATAVVVLVALSRAIRIVPQARAYVVERLGSTFANRWCPSTRSQSSPRTTS